MIKAFLSVWQRRNELMLLKVLRSSGRGDAIYVFGYKGTEWDSEDTIDYHETDGSIKLFRAGYLFSDWFFIMHIIPRFLLANYLKKLFQ